MKVKVKILQESDTGEWDKYVYSKKDGNLYLISSWKKIIEKTYGHKTYYLIAIDTGNKKIVGILPLVHLKHFIFGNSLISIPYFDMGGVLADSYDIEAQIIAEAVKIGRALKVDLIELRHSSERPNLNQCQIKNSFVCSEQSNKVRMLIKLPDSSKALMKSFKSKLRSQIKKPIKEGLYKIIGGIELIDEFYNVFLVNMRDLGSPIHSKKLIKNVISNFEPRARIVIIKKDNIAIAASVICGYKNILENPWSSALRKFSYLSPNMLLYWSMLEYACDNGFKYFDFGRSTPNEGTFKFKEQWGASPEPLFWYYLSQKGLKQSQHGSDKSKFSNAVQVWQKFPVFLTALLGPMIRKHIGL